MTDEELETVLDAALDEDPGDTLARLALADLYEEQGRDAEAEGQRWLVGAGKYPTFSPTHYESFTEVPWMWWGSPGSAWDELPGHPHAEVPSKFLHYAPLNGRYDTRAGAEADLIRYARAAGLWFVVSIDNFKRRYEKIEEGRIDE